jgi:hypothetical protein
MVTVTAVAPMPAVPALTVVCGVVVVPAVACVLDMCFGLTFLDGSVTGFARAVLGPIVVVLPMVVMLKLLVGVPRRRRVSRVRWGISAMAGVVVHRVTFEGKTVGVRVGCCWQRLGCWAGTYAAAGCC